MESMLFFCCRKLTHFHRETMFGGELSLFRKDSSLQNGPEGEKMSSNE